MRGAEGYAKLGYLNEDFHFFHLRDTAGQEHETHYHEFAKIVVFLSGHVDYLVEGTSYPLQPWDILLISGRLTHKAVIDTTVPYERIILYVDPRAASGADEKDDLMRCFAAAEERAFYLMRPTGQDQAQLSRVLRQMEAETKNREFGAAAMQKACFLQLMVLLNRIMCRDRTNHSVSGLVYDARIADTLAFINANLEQELSVEALAGRIYMSKYHFMRRFKELTGYTVHSYILQKRLLRATVLLKEGTAAAAAAEKCGFRDYSTFQRAFKLQFGVTPSAYP